MIIRRTCAATPADFLAFVSPELHFRRLEQEFSADEKLKRIDMKEKNTRAARECATICDIFTTITCSIFDLLTTPMRNRSKRES